MGLNSILLSSTILANSFLSPSPTLTIEQFYEQFSDEVSANLFMNIDDTFKANYTIDDFVIDGYVEEEEDQFYCCVFVSLIYPIEDYGGYYAINITANCYYDYSYNFLGVKSYELVGIELVGDSSYTMFNYFLGYNHDMDPVALEWTSDGQQFEYNLQVTSDYTLLFEESLPEFVLNSGDTPETIYISDFLLGVEDYVKTLDFSSEDKSFFGVLSDTMVNYIKSLTDNFKNLTNLFYVDNKLTFLGILTLIGFGIGITKWGINLVVDLLRL